ncbi:hypothetical protein Tsp_13446 [Trichinella spiralis]|uniref:hypothetical protein n=1 Tax=Trichinella spiralis TaxID=6334 RepID=UPI0001EFEB72|nr:hypothetical protein Tsp_13446 [Trichinella spiralis]
MPVVSGCRYWKCQPQLCRFAGNSKDLSGAHEDNFSSCMYFSKFSNFRMILMHCHSSSITFYNMAISNLSGIIYVQDIIQKIDCKNNIVLLTCFLCAFEFGYVDMVIVYLLRFSKNDVPVIAVLVHFHMKYQIQHSLGIILLDTDHTCMQYSSHVNSGTKI